MSQPTARPSIAIIDARELRRASISSLLGPWAKVERLLLKSFSPDHVREALHSETDVRLLIFSVGGDSIAEQANLQQLKVLRALASNVPLVIISDREDASEIAAAFTAEARGFINSGIPLALAYRALSFVMNGGSYFPPSAMRQLKTQPKQIEKPSPSDDSETNSKHNGPGGSAIGSASSRDDLGCQAVNLTARQQDVLERLRLGESNKIIARRLGMSEGTVKVHIRQMMRKCHASNRIQLALRNGSRTVENRSTVEKVWAQDLSTRPVMLLSKQ